MKSTISNEDYLKLVGVMALAAHHNQQLETIKRAAKSILGLPTNSDMDGGGHVDDEIYGRTQNADALLERLGITKEAS